MKVLAVIWEHCATAAVMVDGEIVACASEERFSRRKNDDSYPMHAIQYVLRESGLSARDLDRVALAGERFDPRWILCHISRYSVADRVREQHEYWLPRLYEGKDLDYLEIFKDKLDVDQFPGRWDEVIASLRGGPREGDGANAFFRAFRRDTVVGHLGVASDVVVFPHHHRAHALYAHYASPRDDARTLILTADAWGDDMNASVSVAEGGRIRRVAAASNFNVARLYRSITLLLGMKPDEHEYKVMGLAPYARPEYYDAALGVFRDTAYVDGIGFAYHTTPPDLYAYFRRALEGQRFDAIAGAIQRYAEEMVVAWAGNALRQTGARRLHFGGGFAMNVKAMMEVAKLPNLDDLFVCPSPADESLAIGAAYVVAHDDAVARGADPRYLLKPLRDAYLGPDLDSAEVRQALAGLAGDTRYRIHDGIVPERIADALAKGWIVGRCVGRSEFGARALGNRSILADPRDPDAVRRINEKVKSRDFWMPFAPSILAERSADYLVNPKGLRAPYMTIAFETTSAAHTALAAALHPADRTCRPQIVEQACNPGYHALLRAFECGTGVGGVLNTSFNIHGEPIVQTAADAVDVFHRSGLDALILGDAWIEKVTR